MLNVKIFILCFVIGVCYSQSCVTDDKNLDDEYFRLSPKRKSTDKNSDKKLQMSFPSLLRQMRSGNSDNIKLLVDKTGKVEIRSNTIPDESVEIENPDAWHVLQPLVLFKSKYNNAKQNAEQRMQDEWTSLSSETSEINKSFNNLYDNEDLSTNKPQFKIEKSDGLIILKPIIEKTSNFINDNSPLAVKRSKNDGGGTPEQKEIDATMLLSFLARLQENS